MAQLTLRSRRLTFLFSFFQWVKPSHVVTIFETLLHLHDMIIWEPPTYHKVECEDGSIISKPIGVPMYIVFDMLCNTSAAHELFCCNSFNPALKELLVSWGRLLMSPASTTTLTTGPEGWFNQGVMADFETHTKPHLHLSRSIGRERRLLILGRPLHQTASLLGTPYLAT